MHTCSLTPACVLSLFRLQTATLNFTMPSAHRVCPAAFTLHIQSPRAYAGTYETPVIYRALRVGHKRMAFNAFIARGHRASRFVATPRAGIRKAHMCVCTHAVYMFASPERARADTLQTQSERAHQIMTQHREDRVAFTQLTGVHCIPNQPHLGQSQTQALSVLIVGVR